jgi:hypothetical protein
LWISFQLLLTLFKLCIENIDMKKYLAAGVICVSSYSALADSVKLAGTQGSPDSHAPIGVMGDHMHQKGEWMLSYRFMSMNMQDNIQGDKSISPEEIATSIPNIYANPPMSPPTLRVVPIEMQTNMHMLGAMWAPSDSVTLMLMLNYFDSDMDHITFAGAMGSERLGTFTTSSSGMGDTKVGALVRLSDSDTQKVHFNIGLSLPTGSLKETDHVLTPMNMTPELRLPYAMQLGSGTYDIESGVTYNGYHQNISWGAQIKHLIRMGGDNAEGYKLGDKTTLSTWAAYKVSYSLSTSLRLSYTDSNEIDGVDSNITAPVQTANPENYGGDRLDLGFGINFAAQSGELAGHRIAIEYAKTLDQDANGVKMEMQDMLTVGYQYAF